jgi:general secretion pathway protein A
MVRHVAIYGLKKAPFSTSVGLVLDTAPVRRAVVRIARKLEGETPWICVAGAPGLGKTSLLRGLPKLLGERYRCLFMDASRWRHGANELDARVAAAHGLGAGRHSKDALIRLRKGGPRLILLVDDVDQLSPPVLERLAALSDLTCSARKPLLQIVSTADCDRSGRAGPNPLLVWNECMWTMHLDPLQPHSMHAYLEKRMRHAGWKGRGLFGETGARAVHQRTGGNPAAVSLLCSKLLDVSSATGVDTIDQNFVRNFKELVPATSPPQHPTSPSIDSILARRPLSAQSIRNAPSLDLAD